MSVVFLQLLVTYDMTIVTHTRSAVYSSLISNWKSLEYLYLQAPVHLVALPGLPSLQIYICTVMYINTCPLGLSPVHRVEAGAAMPHILPQVALRHLFHKLSRTD